MIFRYFPFPPPPPLPEVDPGPGGSASDADITTILWALGAVVGIALLTVAIIIAVVWWNSRAERRRLAKESK